MANKFWMIPLAVASSVVSAILIIDDFRGVVSVFELTDPTGFFGIYLHVGGLFANAAVILVAGSVLLRLPETGKVYATIAFTPPILEAIAVLPCYVGPRPGSLCAVWLVVVSYFTIPIVLVAAVTFIATSRSKATQAVGIGGGIALVVCLVALRAW